MGSSAALIHFNTFSQDIGDTIYGFRSQYESMTEAVKRVFKSPRKHFPRWREAGKQVLCKVGEK